MIAEMQKQTVVTGNSFSLDPHVKRSEAVWIGDSPVAIEEAEQFASLLGRIALSQQFGFAV